jgi:hypothetical protein
MLFDADSAASLADAILRVRQEQVAADLVEEGGRRLLAFDAERAAAERQLQACLDSVEMKIRCWKAPAAPARSAS